jgi:hypothetical protein
MSFMTDRYFQLLESHKLYDLIVHRQSLVAFMERHVISAWAYNALLKSLQRDLLANYQPLHSDALKEAIYLISEMVLDEEVEAQVDGSFQSHLELYLEAMRDVRCDMTPVLTFFDLLEKSVPIKRALKMAGFAPETVSYGLVSVEHLYGAAHQKAAALFYEGEPYIPDRFLTRLEELSTKCGCEKLLDYFERHIEGLKRPGFSASGRLVEILCQDQPDLHEDAEKTAQKVMYQRIRFWDRLASGIEEAYGQGGIRARPDLKLLVNLQG